MLEQVHPVLPSRDVQRSIDFYVGRLGFMLPFREFGFLDPDSNGLTFYELQ